MAKFVSSKHLEGVSDLTLSAPIRQGFIDAFESVTYETRLRLIMKALFKIRSTAREHSLIKPFVDTAERIQALLDFRLAILDTEPRRLLLSATFDRPFEPYMRLIWHPLGPLLDVIFCNCEGYVTATEHGFDEYLAWVRKSQIDSNFFYAASGHSIDDIQYLAKIERLEREAATDRPPAATVVVDDPNVLAKGIRAGMQTKILSNQLGMQALVALYRLADVYPPDQPDGDGKYLRWATQQLLAGWGREQLDEDEKHWSTLVEEQLDWFEADKMPKQRPGGERLRFDKTGVQGGILTNYKQVENGALLLMRIKDAARARKYLGELEIDREHGAEGDEEEKEARDREKRARDRRLARSTKEEREQAKARALAREAEGPFYLNLAFTCRGLANIGVPHAELERFPQEFREGMEERAGLLGDVRDSHPRRWNLPNRYRPAGAGAAATAPVELAEVDIVIKLRSTTRSDMLEIEEGHPLYKTVRRLADDPNSGLELLAVEALRRASPIPGKDHFGFSDGFSQPQPVDGPAKRELDQVARGEIFWGYSNSRGDAPPAPSAILDDGTFLVLRKLRQHAAALQAFATEESRKERIAKDGRRYRIDAEELYGKLMGRRRDGSVMLTNRQDNRFDYQGDRRGEQCPFQAHIRRVNPRTPSRDNNDRPTPRILRRGLSYGPPVDPNNPDKADRGVIFMAYNASISEQYEVIQRWVSGGNSTGVGSWQSDPLMGVSQAGDKRTFQFQFRPADDAECETVRVDIPMPFVTLQWGAYLFVPSMAAIETIASLSPVEAEVQARKVETDQALRGEAIIARLLAQAEQGCEGRIAAAAAWKTCLEDFGSKDPAESGVGPAVWAAIRAYHGGVLRVPYGIVEPAEEPRDAVLVASKDLVMRVFRNKESHYSMCGQMARMKQSFGPIFLGLDGGPEYEADSAINKFIHAISELEAFAVGYWVAHRWLAKALELFCTLYGPPDQQPALGRYGELDLRRNFITPVLAGVCNQWFGIPDSLRIPADPSFHVAEEPPTVDRCQRNHVDPGGWSWEAVRKPRCPGDFLATSRYCFYPDPVPRVQAYGQAQGQALRKAVRDHFIEKIEPRAKVAAEMARHEVYNKDRDKFARTLIGVMTGFLPPADASMRWALYDWLEEKTFWRVQHDVVSADVDKAAEAALTTAAAKVAARLDEGAAKAVAGAVNPYLRAKAGLAEPLARAMQKRPAPDMLWRTAIRPHRLGDVEVEDGDRVFIGIVSAMAEDANAGVTDVFPVFGGKREDQGSDFPLHACPAHKFAMGTMMGVLAALMDSVRVEALPAPLLVRISDRTKCPVKKWGERPAPTGKPASLGAHAEKIGQSQPS